MVYVVVLVTFNGVAIFMDFSEAVILISNYGEQVDVYAEHDDVD